MLLSVAGLTALVVWASVGDLQHGLQRLRVAAPETAADLESRRSWLGDAARQFGLQQRVKDFLDDIPARLAGGSPGAAVRAAATRGMAVVITFVLMVFLISHGPRLVRGLLRQVPAEHRRAVRAALLRAYRRAWGYVVAMFGEGHPGGRGHRVPARPRARPAGLVRALGRGWRIASVVPYLGVAIGGLGLVLLAGGVHGGGTAILAAVGVLALQGAGRAVATALVIQPRTLRVGPAISLAVLLLGTSLYGIGGGAVALAVVTVAMAVLEQLLPELPPEPDDAPARALP